MDLLSHYHDHRHLRSPSRLGKLIAQWRSFCNKPPEGFEKFFGKSSELIRKHQLRIKPKKLLENRVQLNVVVREKNPILNPHHEQSLHLPSKLSSSPSDSQNKYTWKWDFSFGGGKKSSGPNKALPYIAYGASALLGLLVLNELRYKEISWKDFVNNHLARGTVEKLEVVNKKWVRVKFYSDASQANTTSVLWFNIGSVDAFERNLENIQAEMSLEPSNYVSVVYRNEMEVRDFLSFVPTMIIIGSMFYFFDKSRNMMGGRMGGRGGIFGMGESAAKVINRFNTP
ncbi:AFG3-like protein 2 [Panonychus citri]|uniref:AFG3-like protein 2 n=1 Tax=Panonychus citri TaxID=50023 RepID=UPI002307CB69|nr:AFG3-like protein 2 [Panonychus citri]